MNKENFIFFFRCDFTSRRRRQDRRNSHRSNHFFRGFDSPINTPSSPFLCQLTTTSVTGHCVGSPFNHEYHFHVHHMQESQKINGAVGH